MEAPSDGEAFEMAAPSSPRRPRLPPAAFCRTLSMDPGAQASRRSSAGAAQPQSPSPSPSSSPSLTWTLPAAYTDEGPPSYQQSLRSPSVALKIAQFALTVLCLGLISDGYVLEVNTNVTAMHFPFIVFSSYTIITGVIILGYVTGMKMRELLMRIFGTMGGLLFLISSIHTANEARVYWANWEGTYVEGPTDEFEFDTMTIPRRRLCFVAQTALAFAAAALHLADVAYSYRRTMRLLG